ncbi:MAG TPA: transposase, partial [Stellaceae bacterium]|nr:transposase [Stellaceae bacterium]
MYEATAGKPVAIILRPGKTPDGAEVALVLRHVIGRIRARWPAVDIVVRGDGHYARPEAMGWCGRKRIGYIFSLSAMRCCCCAGSAILARTPPLGRIGDEGLKVRRYGEFRYAATSLSVERPVIGRVEAGPQGADSRFIVTNLPGLPMALCEKVYCARGQAENLIKAHKLHLATDRTSCTKATANQFRLLIHT